MEVYKFWRRVNLETITLLHGDGGKWTQELISNIFLKSFSNKTLNEEDDAAIFDVKNGKLAFTTDSFVVNPIFFPGGDIGKLSVCGTINDLVVMGAKPLYLSTGFIIEEGFEVKLLEKIVKSMAKVCSETGVNVVTGDTKVVPKGSADGVFINTSGIGSVFGYESSKINNGDKVIVTGAIGEHGTAIAIKRYNLNIESNILSDCAPISYLLEYIDVNKDKIKFMRDPTRGGLGQVLNEICERSSVGLEIYEEKIPIKESVIGISEILGIDPLYLACEGRMMLVVDGKYADEALEGLRELPQCSNSQIIGEVNKEERIVSLINKHGGKRILKTLNSHMLPRIC